MIHEIGEKKNFKLVKKADLSHVGCLMQNMVLLSAHTCLVSTPHPFSVTRISGNPHHNSDAHSF